MYRLILPAILVSFLFPILQSVPVASLQGNLEIRIDGLNLSQFPDVQATVTVLDQSGRPLVGLGSEAFQASAGGQALVIKTVGSATDQGLGIAVVLAIDVSGSMQGQPLAQAKQAGKALVDQLGPADQVMVLAFADSVQVVQPFTEDRQALAAAIDSLAAVGNTALYDGVARSTELAAQNTLSRRAVILLSDGSDFGGASQVDRAASLATAQASGAPVFAVGFGDQIDQAYLEDVVATTRGQLVLAAAPEQLSGLYQSIGSILRQQYVLTLDASPLNRGDTPLLRITVTHSGDVATAEIPLQLPPPVPPPVISPPAPVVPSPEEPAPEEVSGTNPLLFVLPPVAIALLLLGGSFWWWRRRRQRPQNPEFRELSSPTPVANTAPVAQPEPEAAPVIPGPAWLQLLAAGGNPQAYPVGDSPVTIGFTSDCTVRLPNGSAGRSERVRVWRREGSYMLHNLSRRGSVSVAGRPVVWAVLEEGDEIQIGTCRLVFRLTSPASEQR